MERHKIQTLNAQEQRKQLGKTKTRTKHKITKNKNKQNTCTESHQIRQVRSEITR